MLLESLVTIALITVIMTALTTFFITAMSSTARQRSQQAATQIANSAVEQVRGLGAGGAVSGRDSGSVNTQFDGPLATSARVQPWLAAMNRASDPAAPAGRGGTAALPTVASPQVVNGITYQVNYFLGWCFRSRADAAAATACTATGPTGALQYVRAVVAVEWTDKSCTGGNCVQLTETLLNGASEPTFNFNAAPPPPPALTCVNQSSAVGEAVNRSILASAGPPAVPGCTPSGGVPTYTFTATGLPAGLRMAADATVTGAATTAGPSQVTITITDSFLRRASAAPFTWTVLTPLVLTPPPNQTNLVGATVSVSGSVTGGAGAPYTWTASGLPPGVSIDASTGTMTGTVTTPGSYPVALTVADASTTRTSTGSFQWTVAYAPLVLTTPNNQQSVVGATVNMALNSSGGSGSVVWTDPGATLPPGLRIEGRQVVGSPTTVGLNRQVSLTATDSTAGSSGTVTFTWTVDYGPLTPAPVANQNSTVGAAITPFSTSASGGAPPYTWSDPGASLPPGITISAGGVVSGTPTVTGTRSVTLRVADTGGRTATVALRWTVSAAPTVTSPGDQRSVQNKSITLQPLNTCASGPCTFAVTAATLPTGLTLNPNTGLISGTPTVLGTSAGITVTITDRAGAKATTTPFTWTVVAPLKLTAPPNLTAPNNNGCRSLQCAKYSDVVDLRPLTSGGTGPYTYTVNGKSGELTQVDQGLAEVSRDGSSLRVAATGAQGETVTATVRVTDSTGASVTADFRWKIR